ncbi:MAG: U32 family peptidase [Lachnospiraceae bacterium]|nr:U32 family peptidase [Lachnospiraceae bacterium]
MRYPELLLPAKGPEELRCAVSFGADSVYIGGSAFSLRAKSRNFSAEEMRSGIDFAHRKGAKVYVAANIFAHNRDLESSYQYFEELFDIKPDGILVSDPGLFNIAKEICHDIPIHISTQANNTNYGTFLFWRALGAKRVVCARELSLLEIGEIRKHVPKDLEIEAFVHGSMCMSYSGRCLLSNYLTGRDANQGECSHPCRWKYSLQEETRPGLFLPIEEDDKGTYILNSADLNMIEHIPELIEAGIDCFKVEGRMKNALYVATVARAYRRAIDDFKESEDKYRKNIPYYLSETGKCTVRKFSTGFYFGRPGSDAQIYDESTYSSPYVFLGIFEGTSKEGLGLVRQKNKFSVGEKIEVMSAENRADVNLTIKGIWDEEGRSVESAPHAKQVVSVKLEDEAGKQYMPQTHDIMRKISSE